VDRYKEFAGKPCRADMLAAADALPFGAGSLDYFVASHVLEHLGNPIRALEEWTRALKPGGLLYLIVPDRRYTFDRPRRPTEVAHLFEDYERGTPDGDPTHVEEYAAMRELKPGQTREGLLEELLEELRSCRPMKIHHHVFEPGNLRELAEALAPRLGWEIAAFRERYPKERGDGMLLMLRVTSSPRY
jgi:predicted SAM-dependent methyltransferase